MQENHITERGDITIYSLNASNRMLAEGVSFAEVQHIIDDPESTNAINANDTIYTGSVAGRHISVVVDESQPRRVLGLWSQGTPTLSADE